MTDKPADEKMRNKLDKMFGHLFEDENKRIEKRQSEDLSDNEKRLLDGGCIMVNGLSVCYRAGVWVLC